MAAKFLVSGGDRLTAQVREAGGSVLVEYPHAVLGWLEDAQAEALREAGLEAAAYDPGEAEFGGWRLRLAGLRDRIDVAPDESSDQLVAVLVRLVGPEKGEWLDRIRALGGRIEGRAGRGALLVRAPGDRLRKLRRHPWVEGVFPVQPGMKLARSLLGQRDATDFPPVDKLERAAPAAGQLVHIALYGGEDAGPVEELLADAGSPVVGRTADGLTAAVSNVTLGALAQEPAVRSITPHAFPELYNDQARDVLNVPANNVVGAFDLDGADQIVAVADSGLDTGNASTVHDDFFGRVTGLVSLPTRIELASLTTSPASSDDGAIDANSGHGTHVAGSVLGDGSAAVAAGVSNVPRGVAPAAQLYFQAHEQTITWKTAAQLVADGFDPGSIPPWWPPPATGLYGLPDDLTNLFQPAYAAGARVHTNSWGGGDFGVYSDSSAEVDAFMWNNRDFLILFAAGNEGVDADANGVIDATSVTPPGTAKNCLTVGASENNRPNGSVPTPGIDADWDELGDGVTLSWPQLGPAGHVSDDVEGMAAFSSRGPTTDGRVKPDMVAPGTNVLSARSSAYAGTTPPLWGDLDAADPLFGAYCWSGGTSMATPLVAGAAALVRQHLVQQRGHFEAGVKPSGALIKAFLINGAAQMSGGFTGEVPAGPNSVTGFGRADVTQTIAPDPLGQALFSDEPDYAVESGETRTFLVNVIDPAEPLKVTLCWTDAPGASGAGALQNTLYLQVGTPGGGTLDGDITPFPNPTNNVQQLIIPAPVTAGEYEIRVRGVGVLQHSPGASAGPNPRQDFALVVSNGMGMSLQPVSVAQAIDTSGSMGAFGYLDPTQERAKQLIDFMRINDKVSITEFSKRTGVPDLARTVYPLRLLGSFDPDWTDAYTEINALGAAGRTPIGAGLQAAWDQLSGEPTSRPRAIVLLSDGLNNEPPDPLTALAGVPNDVPIFTVALGTAGSAPTLQAIAASRPNGGYFAVESDEDVGKLHEIYAQIQALATGLDLVGLSSAGVSAGGESKRSAVVEPDAEEAAFTVSWDPSDQARKGLTLVVVGPDGKNYAATTPATTERRGAGHHVVRVLNPKPGRWRFVVRNNDGTRHRFTLSTAVRSPLQVPIGRPWVTAKGVYLVFRALHGDQRLTNVNVSVNLTRPTLTAAQVRAQHGAKIAQVRIPKQIPTRGLSKQHVDRLRLSLYAARFRGEKGGLFKRRTEKADVLDFGRGLFIARLPAVSGTLDVEIRLRGRLGRRTWYRTIRRAIHVPEQPRDAGVQPRVADLKVMR